MMRLTGRRLYSEKAYILSRGFVKQALAFPPAGLQDEIRHYYYTTGHLREVVDHARALMDQEADVQSRDEGDSRWNADVIGSLTAGAKLSLKVTFSPCHQGTKLTLSGSTRVWKSHGWTIKPAYRDCCSPIMMRVFHYNAF